MQGWGAGCAERPGPWGLCRGAEACCAGCGVTQCDCPVLSVGSCVLGDAPDQVPRLGWLRLRCGAWGIVEFNGTVGSGHFLVFRGMCQGLGPSFISTSVSVLSSGMTV